MKPSRLREEFLEHGKAAGCPIVDVHAHHGSFAGIYFPRPDAAAMVETMDRCGVKIAFASSHLALQDPLDGNAATAALLAAHPEHFRGYWVISPYHPMVPEGFPAGEPGFVGFKLHPSSFDYPLEGPGYAGALAHAAANDLPVLTHTWGRDPRCGAVNVRRILERHPDLTLIMGHCCAGEWDEAVRLVSDYPRVYLDLTGMYFNPGIIDRFVAEAGSTRILFGTDLPWFDPFYGVGCVLFTDITDDDRHNILHRNAERLFARWLPVEPGAFKI